MMQVRLNEYYAMDIIRKNSNMYQMAYKEELDKVLNSLNIKTRKPRYIKAQLSKRGLELEINEKHMWINDSHSFRTDLGFTIEIKTTPKIEKKIEKIFDDLDEDDY